ncbi:MAG: DUF4271 domain-containing protein [Bacteroidales bacterium]|nr:DUF4271 domain-containing protein [Bacteroidales bacterium]
MMNQIETSPDTTLTLQSAVFPQPVYVKTIFSSSELRPTDFQITHAHKTQPDWMPAILVLCFILLAWGRVFYPKRIRQILRAPFSKRFINQLTRDGNLFVERITIALGFIYFLTFSLFLYEFNEQILGFTFHGMSGISLYLLIIMFVIGMQVVKVALIHMLGIIFKTREITGNYLLNLLIFGLISGPLLLMLITLIIYLNSVILLYITISVFILLFIFRFVRGFFIGMALTRFSYLFLFVYLCSLEILPLLVLIKFLLNLTQDSGT